MDISNILYNHPEYNEILILLPLEEFESMAEQNSLRTLEDTETGTTPLSNTQNSNKIEKGSEDSTMTESAKNEKAYATGIRLYSILFAAALSIFLVSLDTTIVSTAIPSITKEFGSVDDIGW